MDLHLKNKKIVVCGSTSGIGLGIANGFIKEGANVTFTGRSINKLNKIQQKHNNNNNLFLNCDLSEDEDIKILYNLIKKNGKKLTV